MTTTHTATEPVNDLRHSGPTLPLAGRTKDLVGSMIDSSTSLLTLSVEQAREHGYMDGVAATQDDLLQSLGLVGAPVFQAEMTFWERVVTWVTDPVVGSLLVLVGIEQRAPSRSFRRV